MNSIIHMTRNKPVKCELWSQPLLLQKNVNYLLILAPNKGLYSTQRHRLLVYK